MLVDMPIASHDAIARPKRIFAAARSRAGLTKIDILPTTHYHSDHVGGMAALAKLIPIGMYLDHGEDRGDRAPADRGSLPRPTSSSRRASGGVLQAGDKIALKAVDIQVVMASGKGLPKV